MDSTFLGTLVGVCMRLKNVTTEKLVIARINPRNLDLFKTLGIEQFFRIEPNSAPPANAPDRLRALPGTRESLEQKAEALLEAHQALASADERNVCRFKDVITFLKEDLARLRAARQSSPAPPNRTGG
jgi:hypothetical protein